MLVLIVLLASVQAPDGSRSTDYRIETAAPLIELQTCITREFNRFAQVAPVPIADGVALDIVQRNLFGMGSLFVSIELRDAGEKRSIGFRYRHPMAEKSPPKFFKDAERKCVPESMAAPSSPR